MNEQSFCIAILGCRFLTEIPRHSYLAGIVQNWLRKLRRERSARACFVLKRRQKPPQSLRQHPFSQREVSDSLHYAFGACPGDQCPLGFAARKACGTILANARLWQPLGSCRSNAFTSRVRNKTSVVSISYACVYYPHQTRVKSTVYRADFAICPPGNLLRLKAFKFLAST